MRNFGLTAIIYFMWKNILKSLLLFWLPCLLKGDRSVPAPCFHSKSHCLRVSLLPMPVFCPQFQLLFVLAQVYMEANSLKLQNEARLLTNSIAPWKHNLGRVSDGTWFSDMMNITAIPWPSKKNSVSVTCCPIRQYTGERMCSIRLGRETVDCSPVSLL